MLSNAYLLAKFRFDTAENERHFAEILPKTGLHGPGGPARRTPAPRGRRRAARQARRASSVCGWAARLQTPTRGVPGCISEDFPNFPCNFSRNTLLFRNLSAVGEKRTGVCVFQRFLFEVGIILSSKKKYIGKQSGSWRIARRPQEGASAARRLPPELSSADKDVYITQGWNFYILMTNIVTRIYA